MTTGMNMKSSPELIIMQSFKHLALKASDKNARIKVYARAGNALMSNTVRLCIDKMHPVPSCKLRTRGDDQHMTGVLQAPSTPHVIKQSNAVHVPMISQSLSYLQPIIMAIS